MIAKCPKDPSHKRFATVVHVTEDWVVNEHGEFEEVCLNGDTQVVHGPNTGNIWSCMGCGSEAVLTT